MGKATLKVRDQKPGEVCSFRPLFIAESLVPEIVQKAAELAKRHAFDPVLVDVQLSVNVYGPDMRSEIVVAMKNNESGASNEAE